MEQTIIFFVLTGLFFLLFGLTFYLLIQNILGVPFVPSSGRKLIQLLQDLEIDPTDRKFLDLGSGDGRVVMAARKMGFTEAHGVETNPFLLSLTKLLSIRDENTKFMWQDMYDIDMSDYDVVYAYLTTGALAKIEPKLAERETPLVFVTNTFKFPNLESHSSYGDYHLYKIAFPAETLSSPFAR